MSLELLNTLATLATTIIIGATAIAAIVQLRHLRAGNQIAGQLALRQVLLGDEFIDAVGRVRVEIPLLLEEPAFREFVRAYHLPGPATNADERYEVPYAAALTVGRNMENIGSMVRTGLIDGPNFIAQYWTLVAVAWDSVEPLVRLRREAMRSDVLWEDFEYLTVLARRWETERRSCYPTGVARILPSVESTKTA